MDAMRCGALRCGSLSPQLVGGCRFSPTPPAHSSLSRGIVLPALSHFVPQVSLPDTARIKREGEGAMREEVAGVRTVYL